ncbi:FAD-binding protein, partial [Enterobacter hormaechei]|uniref:FAD-binding protein n=6 Tax=Pseudomonadota TaxID=1224 RepID=UPI00402B01AE
LESFLYVAKRLVKFGFDRSVRGRSMLLTNGNALAARLFRSACELGVPIWLDSPVRTLIRNDRGHVVGAEVLTPKGRRRVLANKGVVLACG